MDRRSFLLEMRNNGTLKGLKPCFVIVKPEDNSVAGKSNGQFVMSYRNGVLYFQKISRIFNMLRPHEDFSIEVKEFICYKRVDKNIRKSFTLFKENGDKLPVSYMAGTKETFSTEDNVNRILKEIEALGIKKMEIDENA